MKKYLLALLIALTVPTALTLAKGKGNANWAEEAALKYEAKASDAMKKGEPEVAKIYKRMAQIKRAAGAASSKGKKFDWSEYHELEGKLNQIRQKNGKGKYDKKKDKKKDKEKKKDK